jgi:hypothetical protein
VTPTVHAEVLLQNESTGQLRAVIKQQTKKITKEVEAPRSIWPYLRTEAYLDHERSNL